MFSSKGETTYTIFFLLLGVWKVGASTEGCPEIVQRSRHFAKVHNGVCYLFVDQEHYWNDARSACWNMGGEMLSIKDEETMKFIRSALQSRQLRWFKEGVWLGARYVRGRWRWTTGVPLDYNNWADGEPSKLFGLVSVEDCALMRRDDNWRWHDYLCGSLRFHYNFICEFPFNSEGHYEAHSGSQAKDNGNSTVLTIILASGGIVLLILLVVFFVVRRGYNYKKLVSSPDVHFDNRSYDLAVHQPAPLPHSSHSSLPPPTHLCNSRPCSNLYTDPPELGAGSLKANGTTVGLLKKSAQSGDSSSTSLSCSDEDFGACGGVSSSREKGTEAETYVPLSSSRKAEGSRSQEIARSGSDSLKQKASRSHSDYLYMNGKPRSASQNGLTVKLDNEAMGNQEGGGKEGGGDGGSASLSGATDKEESDHSSVPKRSSHPTASQSHEKLCEDFA
ncbi:hypothetical protein ACOMHN_022551 [Nucella lapillus]